MSTRRVKRWQRWNRRAAAVVLAVSSAALLTACDGEVLGALADSTDTVDSVSAEDTDSSADFADSALGAEDDIFDSGSSQGTGYGSASPAGAESIRRTNAEAAEALPQGNMDDQRKISHSSEGFEFLEAPGMILPGGRYITYRGSEAIGNCSFGWWVFDEQEPDRHYMTTAGHCGEVGDQVLIEDQQGNSYHVGTFVWSQYESATSDHALIELSVSPEYVAGTPPVEGVRLAGVAGLDWLEQVKPTVCRLGYRTGMSCGQFRTSEGPLSFRYDGITDHGDSGGAIWAVDPQDPSKIWAVGMAAYMFSADATNAGGSALAPMTAEFGLTIVE